MSLKVADEGDRGWF